MQWLDWVESDMHMVGRFLVLMSAFAMVPTPAVAAEIIRVTIDTSGLAGTTGSLTFGFNSPLVTGPNSFNATGTATITNFAMDGELIGLQLAGNTSGFILGTVVLTDAGDGGSNLYSLIELFGTYNAFDLTLATTSVCPITATNCSQPTFTVALNDVPLGAVSLNRDQLYELNGTQRISYSFTRGAVPEPSTWAMMLIGFGGMGLSLRRRRKTMSLQTA